MAVLLGPAGLGLLALYKSIAELAQNVANVGIDISGVRYIFARRLTGFRWSTENKHTSLLFFSLIVVVFSGFYLLSPLFANTLGTLGTLFSGVYSLHAVLKLGGWPSRAVR